MNDQMADRIVDTLHSSCTPATDLLSLVLRGEVTRIAADTAVKLCFGSIGLDALARLEAAHMRALDV